MDGQYFTSECNNSSIALASFNFVVTSLTLMRVINYIDNDKKVNDCLLVLIYYIHLINSLLINIMKNKNQL